MTPEALQQQMKTHVALSKHYMADGAIVAKPWSTRAQHESLAGWSKGGFPSTHMLCLGAVPAWPRPSGIAPLHAF